MSYLAMSAETIQEENSSFVQRKRSGNKTQKYRQSTADFNPQKVNSVLESIHNNNNKEEESELGNYYNNLSVKENMTSINQQQQQDKVPQPIENDSLSLQELQHAYMNEAQVRDYYRKLTNNNSNGNAYSHSYSNAAKVPQENSNVTDKLNYIINILEEQQDQKTDTIAEEVILYSFLGVFIIFVVDSFTKVGKYVR
jgi:hypothetical protein